MAMDKKKPGREKNKQEKLLQAAALGIVGAFPHLGRITKTVDLATFQGSQQSHEKAFQSLGRQQASLHDARLELKGQARALRKLIKKVRAAVLANYGDDSHELELVGGKRLSQRKKPVRVK